MNAAANGASDSGPMPTPVITSTLVIPSERNGPPGMANGGWLVGRFAEELGVRDLTVTLRAPTPLDTPLAIVAGDGGPARLYAGDLLLAEAEPAVAVDAPPAPVAGDAALIAETHFAGYHDHPFPTCFVCGTDREPGEGLRIFPGPVPGRPGEVATLWIPSLAHGDAGGTVPTAIVAAALDCPTGWAHWEPGAVALLGRLSIHHTGTVRVGDNHVVVAERRGTQGRKSFSTAGIFDPDGRCVAMSTATWIRMA